MTSQSENAASQFAPLTPPLSATGDNAKNKAVDAPRIGGAVESALQQTPLTLTAVCGQTRLSIRDLMKIERGAVILLDAGNDDLIILTAYGQPVIHARRDPKHDDALTVVAIGERAAGTSRFSP